MTPQDQFYNEILQALESGNLVLPTLPEVALRVRDVVDEPDVTAKQLAKIITTDAALSTRLIKVANSALYRGRILSVSIQMAVSRLGLNMVRNLVISLVMEQMFQATSNRLDKRLHELWEHSTEVAARSQILAQKHPNIKPDEAMLAGLIHNIGILPILMKAEDTPELLQDTRLLDDVIERLHNKIGAAILESWDFSDTLVAVPREYSNLEWDSENGPDLIDIVQVAHIQSLENTDKAIDPAKFENSKAFKKLGLDTGMSVSELDEDSEEYAEALALFGFDA
jgi:HD-like signal output (HDOD) protein